jgi:hypothetical protein
MVSRFLGSVIEFSVHQFSVKYFMVEYPISDADLCIACNKNSSKLDHGANSLYRNLSNFAKQTIKTRI